MTKNKIFPSVLEVPTFHNQQPILSLVQMKPSYGIIDSVIFPSRVSISCTNSQWSKGFQLFMNNPAPARIVSLVKIKGTTSPLPPLEPENIFSQFIQSSVDPCKPNPQEAIFIFLTFIDDFSRKTWIYFLRNKSDTFSKFKELMDLTKRESRKFIKVLRSDVGGEYDSHDFTHLCKQHEIQRQFRTT